MLLRTSRYTAFLPQGGATAHVGTPWRPAPTRPPAALADGSLVYDKAPGCTAKAITIPQLKAIITARGSKPSGARAALVQVARLLTDTSDTAATTTHDVQDTMPTDPTRTKTGRTKKSEKDPPKNKTWAAHRQPDVDILLRRNRATANKLANLPISSRNFINAQTALD